MIIRYEKTLLGPSDEIVLLQLVDGNQRYANQIRVCLAKGLPIVIRRNGQPLKERALKDWVTSKGGLAIVIDSVIEYELPSFGRGGER